MDVIMKTDASGRERVFESDFNDRKRVVRVTPKNDMVRKYIKHPSNGVGFPADGSCEWPNDAFTKRRIIDGDVTVEARDEQQQAKGGEQPKPAPAPAQQKSE